jgi:hypothetical protein
MSATASREVSPALEKSCQFLAWLVPTLDKFPRRQKFLLGDRIESMALDVLEGLVEATYTHSRVRMLEAVNLKLDKLRFLFRLSAELQLLDQRRYEHASRGIDEIGRLVGGWIRATRAHAPRFGRQRRRAPASPASCRAHRSCPAHGLALLPRRPASGQQRRFGLTGRIGRNAPIPDLPALVRPGWSGGPDNPA